MPKVSIIIPVYNVEAYLPACLDSVLAQTLEDIEVICIDDASPDRCGQILEDYAARDARMQVIHLPENRQQGYGRNRGQERARGKYVYFLDSDDMITPNAMQELYDLAERESLDGIFFDSQVVYETAALAHDHSIYMTERKGKYEDRVYEGPELLDTFMRQEEWTCYIQRQFWNREYLERENIWSPEGVEHEDEVFAIKAILAAKRVRYIPATYFIRRYREDSVMTRPYSARDFYGYLMGYCYMDEFIHERGLACKAADQNLARIYTRMTMLYERLSEKEDLESWFKTPESRRLYYFFLSSRKAELYYQFMREGLQTALAPYRHVYVYGAGRVANTVAKRLQYRGFLVDCFVVTRKEGNPNVLLGRPVVSFDALEMEPDGIVVVAVAPALQREIVPLLAQRRCRYILYDADSVVSFDSTDS